MTVSAIAMRTIQTGEDFSMPLERRLTLYPYRACAYHQFNSWLWYRHIIRSYHQNIRLIYPNADIIVESVENHPVFRQTLRIPAFVAPWTVKKSLATSQLLFNGENGILFSSSPAGMNKYSPLQFAYFTALISQSLVIRIRRLNASLVPIPVNYESVKACSRWFGRVTT